MPFEILTFSKNWLITGPIFAHQTWTSLMICIEAELPLITIWKGMRDWAKLK